MKSVFHIHIFWLFFYIYLRQAILQLLNKNSMQTLLAHVLHEKIVNEESI